MEWCIYKHTNKITGDSYIGQTYKKPEERWGYNGNGYQKTERYFLHAIKKYGWENFEHTILEEHIPTKEKADEREQYYINLYRTYIGFEDCKGYNLTLGGGGIVGYHHTNEAKEKISKNNSRYWKGKELHPNTRKAQLEYIRSHPSSRRGQHCSEKTKEKLRQINLGKPSPMKGRKHSEETIKKLRESHLGKISRKNFNVSEETRQKIGTTLCEYNINQTYENGRFFEETKEKLRQSALGRIYINNGIQNKYIKKETLEEYLKLGWQLGKLKKATPNKKRIRVNNGIITKNIVAKYLDYYLNNGWKIGELKRTTK